jgi:hypothetical protein
LTFEEVVKVLADFHEGPTKRHSNINTIVRKVLTSNYWWPTLNKDVVDMCQTCDICQQLTLMWQSDKGPFNPLWHLNHL